MRKENVNNEIESITIHKDYDSKPEYMLGVDRIESVEINYSNGETESNDDFCNEEFHDGNDIIERIRKRWNVSIDIIEVL